MKILNVAGARPNFVKIAPLMHEMRARREIECVLVHTGQHYDDAMSGRFFRDLDIRPPEINLEVGSGSHAQQTAEVMRRLEPVLLDVRPDVVLVVGDVNSTLAAAVTAAKLDLRVAHVEAGLRSFDRTMPEEINRLLTDAISDFLFVTEQSGSENLRREGVSEEKIHFVGNVMIDALETLRPKWQRSEAFARFRLVESHPYAVLTLHRPSNVDDPAKLAALCETLVRVAERVPILFPTHPRVRPLLNRHPAFRWSEEGPLRVGEVTCTSALGYLDFVALTSRARLVLTDSGGLQEESTVLGVPCLTLRENTERPVTVTHGTNRVVGTDPARILEEAMRVLDCGMPRATRPPLWDGAAAERIVSILSRAGANQPARRD